MGNKLCIYVVLVGLIIAIIHCGSSHNSDPYSVIGVGRTASSNEIKKAYKKLARQWHPDKNKEDGAQEKFIQIQQAYEILSDEEKRAEYDNFGHVTSGNQPRQYHNDHFHFGRGFDNFQFRFTNQGSSGFDPRRVTLEKFESGILPESHRKPFLLFVTGDWCFSCVRVEGVWNEAAADLETLGVGMGTVHGDYSRPLLKKLGVYQWPSIVGIINGKIYSFSRSHISKDTLKEFVQGLLPSDAVSRVTDANQESFFSGWQSDNKPRSLLFSRRSSPSLLYQLLAFKLQNVHTFGFTQIGGKDTAELVWKFDISSTEPTLLIFKEDNEEYVEKHQSLKIDISLLETAINNNRYLFVPRLTSQQLYENICAESPVAYGRSICVILITKNPSMHKEHLDSFRNAAKTLQSFPQDTHFAHIYQDTQMELVKILGKKVDLDMESPVPVLILWRQNGRKVRYDWLPDGWHGNEPDEDKKQLVLFLQQVKDGTVSLDFKTTLPELLDENAPHFIVQWVQRTWSQITGHSSQLKQFIFSAWSESSIAVVVVIVYLLAFFLAFAGLLNTGKEAMQNRNERNRSNSESFPTEVRRGRETDSSSRSRDMMLRELNEETYERFLATGGKGHILLLLLTDGSSQDTLCTHFRQEAYSHVVSQPYLLPSFIRLDKYKRWLKNLIACSEKPMSLDSTDSVGSVLALRPSKNYYFVFRPTQSGQRSSRPSKDIDPQFIGLDDSSESEWEEYSECISLNGLPMWLDRLIDGSLSKINVTAWPTLE
ncbi:dnaJ homolog subfamily C member 16-like [Asterias amurensis]|uniref:dnaJ homolog subfamily C member 16-like n=1 Tax=Asterias amurensis TaxID=7602 RepID=UPI003AB7EDF2